jgi:hypothetical protein
MGPRPGARAQGRAYRYPLLLQRDGVGDPLQQPGQLDRRTGRGASQHGHGVRRHQQRIDGAGAQRIAQRLDRADELLHLVHQGVHLGEAHHPRFALEPVQLTQRRLAGLGIAHGLQRHEEAVHLGQALHHQLAELREQLLAARAHARAWNFCTTSASAPESVWSRSFAAVSCRVLARLCWVMPRMSAMASAS